MLDDLQRIAESLSARLHRSVAIDDPQIRLLAYTSHRDEAVDRFRTASIMQREVESEGLGRQELERFGISEAVDPVRIPGDPALGLMSRVCVPIRGQGILFGYLWLLDDDESATADDVRLATESANAAGDIFFRVRLLGELDRAREREILRDLLSADMSVREDAAGQLVAADLMPQGSQVAVVVVRAVHDESREITAQIGLALSNASRYLAPWQSISTVRGGALGVLLVGGRRPPQAKILRDIGERLHLELQETCPGVDARVGIGPIVATIEQAHESHECAVDAIRVAASVPGSGEVTSWDSLGIYRLLVRLPLDQLQGGAIPEGLMRLMANDSSGVLLETLETYLDQAGNVPASIKRLSIHRTSLYHRLSRIEEFSGMSLGDGGDRLALHLGTKLVRLTGPSEVAGQRA